MPEELLGLLDAFSHDGSAHSLPIWPGRTGWGIPLGSGQGRGGAIRDFHLSEDVLRILEVMPPDRRLRSYPNLPAALTAAPESVTLSAGWLEVMAPGR